jgi:hypothetical protein
MEQHPEISNVDNVSVDVVTLYRYFATAAHMRSLYRNEVSPEWLELANDGVSGFVQFFFSSPGLYLMYTYSSIYLVIEGWRELGLHDPKIDALTVSPFVDRLRRFRNATFHYQRDLLSPKHLEFFGTDDERTEVWLNDLYTEFARFFRENTLPLPPALSEACKGQSHIDVAKAMQRVFRKVHAVE